MGIGISPAKGDPAALKKMQEKKKKKKNKTPKGKAKSNQTLIKELRDIISQP
jgi:large-conductance mechanosensitive channel